MDELACPPQITSVDPVVTVEAGQKATLICHVVSNPEAAVTWFFAGKAVANSTDDVPPPPTEGSTASSTVAPGQPQQTIYLTRQIKGDSRSGTNKSVQLILPVARQQDSGAYSCQVRLSVFCCRLAFSGLAG